LGKGQSSSSTATDLMNIIFSSILEKFILIVLNTEFLDEKWEKLKEDVS